MLQTQGLAETRRRSPSRSLSTDEDWADERRGPRHPEHRLWFHVLRRQIWDFVLYRDAEEGTEEYQLAEDAAGWIWWDGEEESDDDGRPTFFHVCSILGIQPRDIREATLRLTREDIGKLNNQIKEDP